MDAADLVGSVRGAGDCSCTRSPWQCRQFSWRIRLLFALIMIGSWKFWSVNTTEWW